MKSREAHSYGCLMIRLPEALADKVRALAASIPDDRIHDDEDGELGREDSPHVTVKYGLHTGDTDLVQEKMTNRWPIKAKLGKASIFDAPDYIVLKVAITGTALRALNSFVCKEFEYTDTHPEYNPHATIAYMKKNPDDPDDWKQFAGAELEGAEFEVDEVEWSPADGDHVMIPLAAERPSDRVARIALRVAALESPSPTVRRTEEFNESIADSITRAYRVKVYSRFGEMRVAPNGKNEGPQAVVLSLMSRDGMHISVEVFRGAVGRYPPLPNYKAEQLFEDESARDAKKWVLRELKRGFAKVRI